MAGPQCIPLELNNSSGSHPELRNALSSGHINVMFGSGFSAGVVPTLGKRESWFCEVEKEIEGDPKNSTWKNALSLLKAEYFRSVMLPLKTASPTSDQIDTIQALIDLVHNRGTTALSNRINVFTTNYDPLIEWSLEKCPATYNDGFIGREHPKFDSSAFSRLQYEQSLFMEYTTPVVTTNIIKLHGSLTWKQSGVAGNKYVMYSNPKDTLQSCLSGCNGVMKLPMLNKTESLIKHKCTKSGLIKLKKDASSLKNDEEKLLDKFGKNYDAMLCIVNPTKKKFSQTVLERSYYDLLRIYANELDRNNALLLVFGFSFADEHIRDLTVRAAKSNPRLIILISCYEKNDVKIYEKYFEGCNNVFLLHAENDKIGLDFFTKELTCLSG